LGRVAAIAALGLSTSLLAVPAHAAASYPLHINGIQIAGPDQLAWAQHNPVQPQMMVHDLDFYDRASGRYTVEKYLADLTRRDGGIDSVLVWPTRPKVSWRLTSSASTPCYCGARTCCS
jgi:hypothetical protein